MKNRELSFLKMIFVSISLVLLALSGSSQEKLDADIFFVNSSGQKVFTYKNTDVVNVKLNYPAKNVDSAKKETLAAIVSSEIEPDGETITLTETTVSSGVFTGSIKVRESPMAFPSSSFIELAKGDKLLVKYAMPENDKGIEELIFDNAYYKGPEWTFFNTGANHIVLLAPDIQITIDGEPVESGIFVSAFYNKKDGDKTVLANAGGSGRAIAPGGVRWTGQVSAIAVWGTQDSKNNGFAEGEKFKWKIWRPSDGKVYDAVPTYITDDPRISHGETYTKDGISGLKALAIKTK